MRYVFVAFSRVDQWKNIELQSQLKAKQLNLELVQSQWIAKQLHLESGKCNLHVIEEKIKLAATSW
jgi:hypothetical protein